ncbi:hypothetical protein QE439_000383 [Pedobacter agri]|nr:hypothetical protein [Pedobacter agri]
MNEKVPTMVGTFLRLNEFYEYFADYAVKNC